MNCDEVKGHLQCVHINTVLDDKGSDWDQGKNLGDMGRIHGGDNDDGYGLNCQGDDNDEDVDNSDEYVIIMTMVIMINKTSLSSESLRIAF